MSVTAGALTYGIIHLGWAIDANSPWMVIEGLAYLKFCHIGVDEGKLSLNQHDDEETPFDSYARVARTFADSNLQAEWVDKAKNAYDESFHPELVQAGFQWQFAKVLEDAHPVATNLPAWIETIALTEIWEPMYRAVVYTCISLHVMKMAMTAAFSSCT